MKHKTKLDRLREDTYSFGDLPESIRIPPLGQYRNEVVKPIETANLDDIAFALLALESESSVLFGKITALRRLYELARKSGALGADNAIKATPDAKGGSK
jgi:hypothetical protein